MTAVINNREKLDHRLAHLVGDQSGFAPDQHVPVAIVTASGELDEIAREVERLGGSVRHMLTLVDAVSAWVPIAAIEILAAMAIVRELELDETVHIA
jgi:hypothetical protein